MNNLSTNTPFLGLGGGKLPSATGGSPLLSATASDVAASFSEMLRSSGARSATPQPAPQPVEPVQPPPRQQTPSPQAARPSSAAQEQAKSDRAAGQAREVQARQVQARSVEARAQQAREDSAIKRNVGKADAPAEDQTDKAGQTEAADRTQTQAAEASAAPAESSHPQAQAEQTSKASTTPLEGLGLILPTAAKPTDETAHAEVAGANAKDEKMQARGPTAAAASRSSKAAGIEGQAGAGALPAAGPAGAASTAEAASAKPATSVNAPAAAAVAAPSSFEAVLGASQAQHSRNIAEPAAPGTSGSGARLELSQPLHSPAFGPEMAARLSLAAADGVQQAQLHLNPAEMGPVSVQIVVEGQQAQISFHSDQADTRAVLENSLPELAAALRESGLTLSGGGVFQQARNPEEQAQPAHGRSAVRSESSDDDSGVPLGTPIRTTASRGVLDLYA